MELLVQFRNQPRGGKTESVGRGVGGRCQFQRRAQLHAHRGLNAGHQQRRGNPLPGHIADSERQPVGGEPLVVVIIARDHARRLAHAGDANGLEDRCGFRIELLLHFERECELGLQTLLLLGDNEQLFQILSHAVERLA